MATTLATSFHRCGMATFVPAALLSLMLYPFAPGARAQTCGANAQSAIATDRPQITNSSMVVACGSLQLENGFQLTGNSGQTSLDAPETAVRLGVAAKTELRFSVPDYVRNNGGLTGADGFSDVSLGLKQQFLPVGGFDFSVIPSLSLPSGSNAISSHGYDPSLQLPWSRSLTSAWMAAGQFGIAWATSSGRHNVNGQASFYADRQLTSSWDAYVEYSGVFPQRGGPQHSIGFGTAYKLTPHQQLDLHGARGLSSAASDYSVGAGYSVRFQVSHRHVSPPPVTRP